MLHRPSYLKPVFGWRVAKEPIIGRKIVVLEPRRVAAKAAARRMAATLGEEVGKTVGYRVRTEKCVSPETRIEVRYLGFRKS
jgi:HrpA-like RNA helicase